MENTGQFGYYIWKAIHSDMNVAELRQALAIQRQAL